MRPWLGVFLAIVVGASVANGCSNSCVTDADCGSGGACMYKIGSCSAQGQCMPAGKCAFYSESCGCNGSVLGAVCFPYGYASGPSIADSLCDVRTWGTDGGGNAGDDAGGGGVIVLPDASAGGPHDGGDGATATMSSGADALAESAADGSPGQ